MANGSSAVDGDGIRTSRTGGVRREIVAVVVLALGLASGRALLGSGEEPAESASIGPVAAPAERAREAGLPDVRETRPAAGSPRADVAPRTDGAARVAADAHDLDEGAAPAVDLPKSRGAQLRALRKLGIKPSRGPDGTPQLDAAPVIEALHAAGVHEGIAAFPPPGTDPPKPGIIVPDGFALPEGYVRHYQSTDDGEALPPILMFHPDYEFVREDGAPIVIPPDRVVPPELAPPGMAIELLAIPERGRSR